VERSRFGEIAVRAGYLSRKQLAEVQAIQEQDIEAGAVPRPIGIICLEKGYLRVHQMMAVLERAEREAGRAIGRRSASARRAPRRREVVAA
jgi:hypothetical protein